MKITADCIFKRKYMYSMGEKYSKFRRKGTVSINDDKIIIKGKRGIHPAMLRGWVILCVSITPALLFGNHLLFWMLVLISYYLFQYVFLKEESLSVAWNHVIKYEIDTKKRLIALAIDNNPSCSPIVFKSNKFEEIAAIFREHMQEREKTSHGLTAVEQRYDEQISTMAKFMDKLIK
jgi:hypothetical protein